MKIAIDFDGTIAVAGKFPAIDGVMPGALEAMRKLKEEGHYLIVWTCRTGDDLIAAVNWLQAHGIPYDRINDNCPDLVAHYGGSNSRKISADCYIDDRNLGGFCGWDEALQKIGSMYDGCWP